MHLPKIIATITLLLFCFTNSIAQKDGTIRGTFVDKQGLPADNMVVTLLGPDTLTVIQSGFTDSLGIVEFKGLAYPKGYFVSVDDMGYQPYRSALLSLDETANKVIALPNIILEKGNSKSLKEVTVTQRVPFVVQKVDRTVVNPDALISNAGSSALDVLAKSPGVMVGQNGDIKFKGKSGVTIFIDDKPTYLTGTELENYLKSLPSNAIKQIELMTNPPAKYEAAGNAGVINIVTKRNKLRGLNGNLSLNYGQGRYARTNDNVNLNYNTAKIALFSNISFSQGNTYHDLTIKRHFKNADLSPKSGFEQNTYLKSSSTTYNVKLGMDYYLTEKTTIGITTKGLLSKVKQPRYNKALVTDAAGVLTQTVIADNVELVDFKNGTITANFRHKFDKPDQSLTADLDYVNYNSTIDQRYKNDIFLPDNTNIYKDNQNGHLPAQIHIYAFKSDYTMPLQGNARLDLGVKTSYTTTDNNAIYTITQDNITKENNNLSNHFLYNEWINAAYINYSKSFKKLDIQAGLRFEDTRLQGKQLGNPVKPYAEFNNDYNGFFPTVYLSYKLDSLGTQNFNLSYGKRVDRPFYKDLNPFSSPLDQYTFYEGNPYLKPTFAHNFSLSHNYGELLTTNLSYSYTKDRINETIEIKNGIYYSRPGNIGASHQYTLSVQSKFNLVKWLTTIIYSEVSYTQFKSKLYTQTLNSKGTYWYINANNIIQLSKQWSAEVSGMYMTPSVDAQFTIGQFGYMSVGLQKSVLKDKGTLKFNLSDVFFTNQIRGRINNLDLTDANWYGPTDSRVASLTFSYRFGNNTNKKAKYNGSGSESEQGRVKM
ncbi:TonB-dependent receptor [Taibaiella sp. KBW10]|uniref:outer membrane beta-barrel protein n=1 Tax=Taibaiella sp. KBW10 TaxID=2153357 RepID=UPI000F5B71F9|nr:outer membrane beta-barrel protein [Taibaiella sp. KBW10]RQO30557.1 TonB-dependent receptor [Taibaiella sp. KBW10]